MEVQDKHSLIDQQVIDSKDRITNSNSTTDFSINIDRSSKDVKYIQIVKVIIPLSQDNITQYNDTFTCNATPYTLTHGGVDIDGLINMLNTLTTGVYTWIFTDYGRIKISADDTNPFTFLPGIADKLLGFDSSLTYTGVNNYVGDYFPDLGEAYDYLTLHSRELHKRMGDSIFHTDYRSDVIMVIPINKTRGEIMTYEPHYHRFHATTEQQFHTLDFQLRDKNNRILDIGTQTLTIIINRYS